MKLIWHGHSCFSVETEDRTLVLDPYGDDTVPGLAPLRLRADAVYCSHGHPDHGARQNVTLTGRDCPVRVETVPSFHDAVRGLKRGKNTIHLIAAEGLRIAHLGDLGHMLTGGALEALRGLDAVLIPVGGYYTIDAKTAKKLADTLSPRVVVPMHYRLGGMGYDVISELSDFTSLCGDVTFYDGNVLDLTADTPSQTAVLRYVGS